MLSCFHRKILSELWWAVGSQSTNRSVTMTAAVPLLWHCMKVWSQPSTAPGPDKPKHCKGNIDPGSAVTLAGGCTEPAELILWSKDRHVMSSVQCYVHSHCTLVLRTLHAPIQTSMWITQVGHWSTGQWTDDCITRPHVDRVNVIFHNELHSVSLCNVSGPGAGGGGVRCPTQCLWEPITITTSVLVPATGWAGDLTNYPGVVTHRRTATTNHNNNQQTQQTWHQTNTT